LYISHYLETPAVYVPRSCSIGMMYVSGRWSSHSQSIWEQVLEVSGKKGVYVYVLNGKEASMQMIARVYMAMSPRTMSERDEKL
jgi:hypothetical protein